MLTSYLIDHYQKHSSTGTNVCYFFFKDDNVEQRDAVVGLSAVLYQLYAPNEELFDVAIEHSSVAGTSLKNFEHLWMIFEDSLECAT